MRKIRFGILGTAKIAREKTLPALAKAQFAVASAIASRSPNKAAEVAQQFSIPKVHASYEALLADPRVDAVYIPLPNNLHATWTLKAMAAGKHVLCEKPLGMNGSEVNRIIDATARYPDVKVMEAFMYRHHPQWAEIKALVDAGEIGELRTIQTLFSYSNVDPDNIRNRPETGGGALLDIGCYAVSLSRFLFNAEPRRVICHMNLDPEFGTDRTVSGLLGFRGRLASFSCSTQAARFQRATILGSTGRIDVPVPFNPAPDRPAQFTLQRDRLDDPDLAVKTVTLPVCDQYVAQIDNFARAVLDDTPTPVPLTDAWANIHALEALAKSVESEKWELC